MSSTGLARVLIHRARREARPFIGRWPSAARRFRTGEFPTRATEVCIEGFLRSGNTFAVIAFQHAQPRQVSIAHHVHAAGAVIAAVRMGTPTIVLIRPPEESVLSYVTRWPELTIGHALRGYTRFYAPLVAHRDRFVIGRFDEVTTDLGMVMRRVNKRFGPASRLSSRPRRTCEQSGMSSTGGTRIRTGRAVRWSWGEAGQRRRRRPPRRPFELATVDARSRGCERVPRGCTER